MPNGSRKGVMTMSKKKLDNHGRWRNKIVAFRVSPEEDQWIEAAVRLSGLTKQEYIIRRLQEQDIVVQGNPRVYKALKNELRTVLERLQQLNSGETIEPEMLETIRLITITLDGMKWS